VKQNKTILVNRDILWHDQSHEKKNSVSLSTIFIMSLKLLRFILQCCFVSYTVLTVEKSLGKIILTAGGNRPKMVWSSVVVV